MDGGPSRDLLAITGGAIFALTAWIAVVGMRAGAGLMDRLLDGKPIGQRRPSDGPPWRRPEPPQAVRVYPRYFGSSIRYIHVD